MLMKKLTLTVCCCILILLCCSAISAKIITDLEKAALVDMLNEAGFEQNDLNFLKDWDASTKFKLECQVEALNNPWQFFDLLQELKEFIADFSAKQKGYAFLAGYYYPYLTGKLCSYLDVDAGKQFAPEKTQKYIHKMSKIKSPKDCFQYVDWMLSDLADSRSRAFTGLASEQIDSLSCWLYQVWGESEDSLAYNQFLQQKGLLISSGLNTERAIELLQKIDLVELGNAWINWEYAVILLQEKIATLKFSNSRPVYHKSQWGTMIIGTKGDDHYYNDKRLSKNQVCFILEPGGNDVYDCDLFTDFQHPGYLIIDFAGNDIYRNDKIGRGMSVLAGCGTVLDFEGNDFYQYSDFAQSAILGFHYLRDEKGNDVYSSGLFTQGAAMFGISILQDNEGNDTYTATEFAQGVGGPKGFGLLLDGKGNDIYYAGGKYLHAPLAPFDYRSMAQGFGFGFRPDIAGGIGILYDGEGNDRYSGGVYAQGVAYWYAIGALIDVKGNDYYDAVYYPQGSGIHLANGALIDMEGEDHYYSKHGPGQGNGHDWSVGVFIDRKGNDHYSVEGGNGLGLTNSVGIFIDSEGDDKYEHRNPSNYGFANSARESGGLGLFLDAGGKDVYPDTTKADNKTWQQGTYGIGRDIELNIPAPSKLEELAEQSVADVDSLAAIEDLFKIASEWEVGSAAKSVKLAREYLLSRETEAVPYAIREKIATRSGLEYRALSDLAKKSELMRTSLYAVLHDADSLKVKNSIALIAEQGDSLAVDSLAVFLAQNKYIPTVLSALGNIKSRKSLELIAPWMSHHTEKYRYLAARSLKVLNSEESIVELRKMANDSSFLIKAMVRQLPDNNKDNK